MPDLAIADGVWIPATALDFQAVRASGPGGQNVNKVATKVALRVALIDIVGLEDEARGRLAALAGRRLAQDGFLTINASDSRHQFANRQLAQNRLVELIREAMIVPVERKPTRIPRSVNARRLTSKKILGAKKRTRGERPSDE